ncbi:MAG: SUMF1/EgtB/PvdO family nonheme iron enzyme [Prosthecobacter sp.]|uniref:SUMF1/EgtB/PvdO family nonheme iron enzyme n=1 Tax=Prosthecobacter sp. TaxID=1965333 RepID=UPI003901E324
MRNHGADTCGRSSPVRRHRVLRGGSWNNNDRGNLLSSNRNHNVPGNRNNNNGFRCVLVVSGGKALEPAVRTVRPRKQSAWIRMGRKLCANGAKKEPNPDGFPLGKTQRAGG